MIKNYATKTPGLTIRHNILKIALLDTKHIKNKSTKDNERPTSAHEVSTTQLFSLIRNSYCISLSLSQMDYFCKELVEVVVENTLNTAVLNILSE